MMDVLMIAGIILWALVLCWAISASVEEERRNKAREDVRLRTSQGRRLPPRNPNRTKRGL